MGVASFNVVQGSSSTDVYLESATDNANGTGNWAEVLYLYFDQSTSASGQLNCPGAKPPLSMQFNMSVNAGWNTVVVTGQDTPYSESQTWANGTPPSGAEWLMASGN
jgi:hypothetical protein